MIKILMYSILAYFTITVLKIVSRLIARLLNKDEEELTGKVLSASLCLVMLFISFSVIKLF